MTNIFKLLQRVNQNNCADEDIYKILKFDEAVIRLNHLRKGGLERCDVADE